MKHGQVHLRVRLALFAVKREARKEQEATIQKSQPYRLGHSDFGSWRSTANADLGALPAVEVNIPGPGKRLDAMVGF
ncbi:hypothetical protein [Roseibium sp. RKSG952]|uniref:hypothetical protein n=1 Tax=Roseibium sp. RKSG952 TaxID=2529384 RepID=UPI0012BBE1D2|nr:hypothetical protein [Roseibium sp. RKSG952]MTI02441.1 hypothetical protein [Roseibium sp. RKSG952]